jgi:FkbM family methyltransferase
MLYFDIGSNIGKWTLANIDKCNKIISVEASPYTYKELLKNCENNNKIVTLNYAVSNIENYVTFYQADTPTLSTTNKEWLTDEKSRFYNTQFIEIRCQTITIDKLIDIHGVPDLIKIDVEGGEFDCITSLTRKVNSLCFEWASETNDITLNCMDYLYQLGYHKFYIQFEDEYTYKPDDSQYYDINTAKDKLSRTIVKQDWGMMWCK